MEMVDGDSLRKLLENVSSFDLHRASHILSQACAAVEAAHQRGIIHRDLKPDNIIVTQTDGVDSVKVLDFGIAKTEGYFAADDTAVSSTHTGWHAYRHS